MSSTHTEATGAGRPSVAHVAGVFAAWGLLAVVAQADASAAKIDLVAVEVSASSTLPGRRDRYAAARALDGKRDTAWCEGKKGDGVGEELTITLGRRLPLSHLNIAFGMRKSERLYTANNIPTAIDVSIDAGDWKPASFSDDLLSYPPSDAKLAVDRPARRIRLRIKRVKPGRMNDTCISEVSIQFSKARPTPVLGVTQAQADLLGSAMDRVDEAFASCNAAALAKTLRFPLRLAFSGRADRYADAKALANACRAKRPMPRTKTKEPSIDSSAYRAVTVDVVGELPGYRWDLAWDRDRWQLVGVDAL